MKAIEASATNSPQGAVKKTTKKVAAKQQAEKKSKGKKKAAVEAKVVQAVEAVQAAPEAQPEVKPKSETKDIFGVLKSTQAGIMNAMVVEMVEKGKKVDGESLRKALGEKFGKKRVDSHVAWMKKHGHI